LQHLGFLEAGVVPRSYDAVTDVDIETAGEVRAGRVDVNELRGEIGVERGGGSPEFDYEAAGQLQVLCQRGV